DLAMATERRAVGESDVPADDAIMRDVGIGKEVAVFSHDGLAAAGVGAGVHGHAFADRAVGADDQRGAPALVLGVLRRRAKGRHRKDLRAGTDGGRSEHGHMADEFDTVPYRRIRADMAEWADAHTGSNPGAALDDGGRMYDRLVFHFASSVVLDHHRRDFSFGDLCAVHESFASK